MSREVGRPSLLDEEMLQRAKDYMLGGFKDIENVVPSAAGLACYLGVSKKTIFNWANVSEDDENNPLGVEFLHTLNAIQDKQEMMLINGGLSQVFSGTITKLMLTNHGYSDKVQTDVTTNGESVNKPSVINLVAPSMEK